MRPRFQHPDCSPSRTFSTTTSASSGRDVLPRDQNLEKEIQEHWKPPQTPEAFWDSLSSEYTLTELQLQDSPEDSPATVQLERVRYLPDGFCLPFHGHPKMTGPLLVRRSLVETFSDVLEAKQGRNKFIEGTYGGGKTVSLNTMFLLAILQGRRDIFCHVAGKRLTVYLHKEGQVFNLDVPSYPQHFTRDDPASSLLKLFPSLEDPNSLLLCDPAADTSEFRPLGDGSLPLQTVIANSSGRLDPDWRTRAMQDMDFQTLEQPNPDWEEFREMATVLGYSEVEARMAFLAHGPVLRNLESFRLSSEDRKELGMHEGLEAVQSRV